MNQTLAIVGSHPRTRLDFDFKRTDCDIWVFNEALSTEWAKRADAVFQLHPEPIWQNPKNRNDPAHYDWLKNNAGPEVYMQERYAEVPKSVQYPLNDAIGLLSHLTKNGTPVKYFSSSVDYALALACLKGYQKIEVYGIELETQTEYFYQRAGFTFWLGYCAGRGIELDLHSGVLDGVLYGYEGEVVLDYALFVKRMDELNPDFDRLKPEYEAQQEITNRAFDKFVESGAKADAENFFVQLTAQRKLGCDLNKIEGARQENRKYIAKADAMKEQSDAFIFSRQEFEMAARELQSLGARASKEADVFGGRSQLLFESLFASRTSRCRNRCCANRPSR